MAGDPLALSFVLLALALYGLVLVFLRKAGASLGAVTLASILMCVWLALTGSLAGSGYLISDVTAMPPILMRVVAAPALLAVLVLTFLPATGRLLRCAPLDWLVSFQAFRIVMELILYGLAEAGTIPVRLTFTGWNFDVLTGVAALPVGYLMHKGRAPRWSILAFNLGGLGLLAIVATLALLSAPTPLQAFHDGPTLRLPFHVPFVWLPGFVVPLALLGHLLSLRGLRLQPVP